MVIGSHNAWSYLTPVKWWMKLLSFTARCQKYTILELYYNYDVRCFDLRLLFDKNNIPVICHGIIKYKYSFANILHDLSWLCTKNNVTIRVALELRGIPKEDWSRQKSIFKDFYAKTLKSTFPQLDFVLGRSLPDWEKLIDISDGDIIEKYSSVSNPKYIDDWFPYLYAKLNNRKNMYHLQNYNKILLIDFVNIR